MNINARTYRAFGLALPVIDIILLWKIVDPNQNLMNTGLTPGIFVGLLNALLVYWIYKNKI